MAIIFTNMNNISAANIELDNVVSFNVGRGGQYKYAYLKRLKTGKYQVGLLKEKPKNEKNYNQIVSLKRSKGTTIYGTSADGDKVLIAETRHKSIFD